jgi:hypothetical protein
MARAMAGGRGAEALAAPTALISDVDDRDSQDARRQRVQRPGRHQGPGSASQRQAEWLTSTSS